MNAEALSHLMLRISAIGHILFWVLLIDLIARLGLTWNALSNERGADRICWFLVLILCPIFGTFAYILIGLAERNQETEGPLKELPPESLAWANRILDRDLKPTRTKPAKDA